MNPVANKMKTRGEIVFGLSPGTAPPRDPDAGAARERESLLETQAKFLGLLETDAASHFVGLVRKQLQDRIRELVEEDSTALALEGLLRELGVQEDTAHRAIQDLYLLRKDRKE